MDFRDLMFSHLHILFLLLNITGISKQNRQTSKGVTTTTIHVEVKKLFTSRFLCLYKPIHSFNLLV